MSLDDDQEQALKVCAYTLQSITKYILSKTSKESRIALAIHLFAQPAMRETFLLSSFFVPHKSLSLP